MNRVFIAGAILTAVGIGGYAAGIAAGYPGRSFAVTAFMVGVTLLAIRNVGGPRGARE